MTKHECAVITAYTDVSMLKGDDLKYLFDYLSGFIGRKIYTHEIPAVAACYREEIKKDFLAICGSATDA